MMKENPLPQIGHEEQSTEPEPVVIGGAEGGKL
jgi:hypothetical protein